MKISINWLNDWVEVGDLEPEALAHRLTMAGLEVDSIDHLGRGMDDIVVGRITAIKDHPNADRLVICEVDTGEEQQRTIVCGATNMSVGDRVPTALPGARPPGVDFEITRREVMGVASAGMLCSEEELELAEESKGLMIIDEDVATGEPVFEALDLVDSILAIDLTPNRSDCLSHLGVAREVAALYDRSLRPERVQVGAISADKNVKTAEIADLNVIDDEGCPQYRMAIIEDVEVASSPAWLQRRLAAVGVRPVNFVVDVTNYVLMDVGQPLHAFDLDCLQGPEIVVRRAKKGETLVGIDHERYELDGDDLVICDAEGPVALAGVMGGERTEVSETTSRVLLECAFFDPTSVRRASKRHGLHTESSHRFERTVDAGGVEEAMERAVKMLVDVQREATGQAPAVCGGVEVAGDVWPGPATIDLDPERASSLVGVEFDQSRCRTLLESIGVEVAEAAQPGQLRCTVPTYRSDLRRSIDLVEELARLYGYDNIPSTLPRIVVADAQERRDADREKTIVSRDERDRLEWVRATLLDQGLLEAINYSFMGEQDLDRLRLDGDDCRRMAARVANPLVKSQARMRTTLVASLLDNLKTNFAQRRHDVGLFEIGRRYFTTGEQRTVGVIASGRREGHWSGDRRWDFFDLKGIVESLATPWAVDGVWSRPEALEPFLHPGVQAVWKDGDGPVLGFVGQLHPAVAQDEGIEAAVYVAEIDLERLIAAGPRHPVARPPAKYPAVVRDFALLYERDRAYADLKEAVEALAESDDECFGPLFEALELFDVYEGQQVPEGMRSLAIKITYRSSERTLEESDVEAADRQLLSHLEAVVGARLR